MRQQQKQVVLVVDSRARNRALLKGVFAIVKFKVELAMDLNEAHSRIEASLPDLVVLDLERLDFLRELRSSEHTLEVPVIILTASNRPEDIELGYAAGADDYIIKPVDPRIMLARAKSMVRARQDRLSALQGILACKERDAMLQEQEEARILQQGQLPPVPIVWQDWNIDGVVIPCGAVGGDTLLILSGENSKIVVAVDVAGHGTAAALVGACLRSELRGLLSRFPLTEAIARLNNYICGYGVGKYACIVAVEVCGSTVSILNAGLPPVSILRNYEQVESIEASGVPPGLFPDQQYELCVTEVKPGDSIIIVSDGVTEPFGAIDDVKSSYEKLGFLSIGDESKSLSERLEEVIGVTSGEAPDDATLVRMEYRG